MNKFSFLDRVRCDLRQNDITIDEAQLLIDATLDTKTEEKIRFELIADLVDSDMDAADIVEAIKLIVG